MFSPEELRLLEKTLDLREKIIDNRVKQGMPSSEKDINAATNLLESIDRSIFSRHKLKIEEDSNANQAQTKELLKELLISVHSGKSTNATNNEQGSIPSFKGVGISLNEGETTIGVDSVEVRNI